MIKVYIATSLNGMIADENDNLGFLDDANAELDFLEQNKKNPITAYYQQMYENTNIIVMGKKTYQIVEKMSEEDPYKDKETIVITNDLNFATKFNPKLVTYDQFKNSINHQKNYWLVGGGQLITQMLNDNLVDSLELTIIPQVIPNGVNLFTKINLVNKFKLTNTITYKNIVQLNYQKTK